MGDEEYHVPYQEVRDGSSIRLVPGMVVIPTEFPILDVEGFPPEMKVVVDTALSIYESWLISTAFIFDDQPRLLLTCKANIPQEYATLRVNLGKLSTEVTKGLSPAVLRQALNFLG